jgi:hypothetical protein
MEKKLRLETQQRANDLEARLAATTRLLTEARAVLADLLEERGESWLAQLVGRREELEMCLTTAGHPDHVGHTPECGITCMRGCRRAAMARIVGGDVETQRQVDAAHAVALKGSLERELEEAKHGGNTSEVWAVRAKLYALEGEEE